MTTEAKLGPALRALRQRNGWTLSDVSRKTGLSISTLSKTERNMLSLTFGNVVKLSEGLEVDIATFFEDAAPYSPAAPAAGRRSVNRAEAGKVITTPHYRYTYLCADLLNKRFVPMMIDVRARSLEEFGELVRHAGDEFAFVLEGTLVVHTEHYAPVVLKAGESIYFESRMAHAFVAQGDALCHILSVSSAPEVALTEVLRQPGGAVRAAARQGRTLKAAARGGTVRRHARKS